MKVRKAVILVAGFGTRFLPATKATPKEMFPLVDKPVAQYAVEEAAAAGIEEVIFVTGQAKRAIEDHFDRNFELEYLLDKKGKHEQLAQVREISEMTRFAYVRQKEMKGWGHALLQARMLVDDEPFAVMLPDDVFTGSVPAIGELIERYEEFQASIVGMLEVPEADVHRYGVVAGEEVREGVLKMSDIVEKPATKKAPSRYAVMGRYILTPDIFPLLENLSPGAGGEIVGTDAIRQLIQEAPVYASQMSARRHDAGEKLGYLKAVVEIALERDDLGDDFRTFLNERLQK